LSQNCKKQTLAAIKFAQTMSKIICLSNKF